MTKLHFKHLSVAVPDNKEVKFLNELEKLLTKYGKENCSYTFDTEEDL